MGMTLAEKILSNKCGKNVSAGDYVIVDVDKMYVNEGSGPLAVTKVEEITKRGAIKSGTCLCISRPLCSQPAKRPFQYTEKPAAVRYAHRMQVGRYQRAPPKGLPP